MKTLHRTNTMTDTVGWCGQAIDVLRGGDNDGTSNPLNTFGPQFALCTHCVAMHGDMLPSGTSKPSFLKFGAFANATPAKKDDGFNGDCRACGKRTYTGCTPAGFEHQDGPCLKGVR